MVTLNEFPLETGGVVTHCHGEVMPRSELVCSRVSALEAGQDRVRLLPDWLIPTASGELITMEPFNVIAAVEAWMVTPH